jgi:hypothetical protein
VPPLARPTEPKELATNDLLESISAGFADEKDGMASKSRIMNDELKVPRLSQIQDIIDALKHLAREGLQTHGEIAVLAGFSFFIKEMILALVVTEVHDGSQTLEEATKELRSRISRMVCGEILRRR